MSAMIERVRLFAALLILGACVATAPSEEPVSTEEDPTWPEGSIPDSLTLA